MIMVFKYIIAFIGKIKFIITDNINKYILYKEEDLDFNFTDDSYLDDMIKKNISESTITLFGYKGELQYDKNGQVIMPSYELMIEDKMKQFDKRYKKINIKGSMKKYLKKKKNKT